MQGLKTCPRECRQQEVVQEEGGANTQTWDWVHRQPAIQQEDEIEEENGQAELDQDLSWNISEQFSARIKIVHV